jgi:hypothetical protein
MRRIFLKYFLLAPIVFCLFFLNIHKAEASLFCTIGPEVSINGLTATVSWQVGSDSSNQYYTVSFQWDNEPFYLVGKQAGAFDYEISGSETHTFSNYGTHFATVSSSNCTQTIYFDIAPPPPPPPTQEYGTICVDSNLATQITMSGPGGTFVGNPARCEDVPVGTYTISGAPVSGYTISSYTNGGPTVNITSGNGVGVFVTYTANSSPTGRYKCLDTNQCGWDPNDSGPNQCSTNTDCASTPPGGDGGGSGSTGSISCMQTDSAVRGGGSCGGSVIATSNQASASACQTYCNSVGATACEWSVGGTCYAESATGCILQSGFSGWYAGAQGQTCTTPTPAPTASISGSPISITSGNSSTISWLSTNATSCSVSPSGWTGTSGSQSTGALSNTTTYTVSCTGAGGSTSNSVTVGVSTPVVNGSCGTANKTYTSGATSYGTDTFCSVGTPSPTTPTFPSAGSSTNWSCLGSGAGTNASCTATRSAVTGGTYSVTVAPATGGTVRTVDSLINCGSTCSRTYTQGAVVTLQAYPASSYWKFNGWSGDCTGTGLCVLTVNGAKSVSATFSLRSFNYSEF